MGALSMPSLSILSCTHHSKLPLFGADPAAARGINFATQRYPSNWKTWKKTNGGLSKRNILQGCRAIAETKGSSGRYKAGKKEVIMVDPVEAKRLAAAQMQQLQADAKFKRQRKIEAINGGWAMLGLTAGLVIEAKTGDGILSQLAGYLNMFAAFLDQYIPS